MSRDALGLTLRQVEIMESLCRHGTAKLVADEMGIRKQVVDEIIRRAMRTMGVRTRLEAALKFDRCRRPTVDFRRAPSSVFTIAAQN